MRTIGTWWKTFVTKERKRERCRKNVCVIDTTAIVSKVIDVYCDWLLNGGDDICIRFFHVMVIQFHFFFFLFVPWDKNPFELRVCQPCSMGSPLVMTVTRPRKYLTSPKQVFNEVSLSPFVPFMVLLLFHSGIVLGLLWLLCVSVCECMWVCTSSAVMWAMDKTTLMMIFVLSVVLSVCFFFRVWCTPTEIEVNIIGVISIIPKVYISYNEAVTPCRL